MLISIFFQNNAKVFKQDHNEIGGEEVVQQDLQAAEVTTVLDEEPATTDAPSVIEVTEPQQVLETVTDNAFDDQTVTTDQRSDGDVTTMMPDSNTDNRVPDVPKPELVKEFAKEPRRQDIEQPPPVNLFRPIVIRPPIQPPTPVKVDEKTNLNSFGSSVALNQPQFAQLPFFPPSSFFSNQPPVDDTPPVFSVETPTINGQLGTLSNHQGFPLPPQIKLKPELQTPQHFIHPQPHPQPNVHQPIVQSQNVGTPIILQPTTPANVIEPTFSTVNDNLPSVPTHQQNDITQALVKPPPHISQATLPVEPLIDNLLEIDRPLQPDHSLQATVPDQEDEEIRHHHHKVDSSAIAFNNYPAPHAICFTEGLKRDPFRCQIFHECVIQNNQWQMYTWRCPRGKYFDPSTNSCVKGFC